MLAEAGEGRKSFKGEEAAWVETDEEEDADAELELGLCLRLRVSQVPL